MLTFFTKQGVNLHHSDKFYTEMLKRDNKSYANYLVACFDQGIEYYAHKAVEDKDWRFQLAMLKNANIWHLFRRNNLKDSNAKLILYGTKILEIPSEVGNMSNLCELDLSNSDLTSIPKELGNLTNLKILKLDLTHIRTIPKEFGNLLNLEELSLILSGVESLPAEIGNLPKLISCHLGMCKNLNTVPVELKKITDRGGKLHINSWVKFQ